RKNSHRDGDGKDAHKNGTRVCRPLFHHHSCCCDKNTAKSKSGKKSTDHHSPPIRHEPRKNGKKTHAGDRNDDGCFSARPVAYASGNHTTKCATKNKNRIDISADVVKFIWILISQQIANGYRQENRHQRRKGTSQYSAD